MVKAVKLLAVVALLILSTPLSSAWEFRWKKIPIDGSLTGVTAPTADNVEQAVGHFEVRTYVAPNGRRFRKGATVQAARLMLDAQPVMAPVKEVIGYSTQLMTRYRPECPLSDWLADELVRAASEYFDRKVDIGLTNFGGIRVDMPQGAVTVDDIMSMFPFKNHICYVSLKGSDVRALFEQISARAVQVVSGVRMVVENGKLKSIEVGGEPLDDDRIYGLATIDFLLNGGDNIFAARNAVELLQSDILVYDMVRSYVERLTAEGKNIEYHTDGRVTVL